MCWLAANDPSYRAHFAAVMPAAALPTNDCIHRGEPTGELVRCGTCKAGVMLKLLRCAVHGDCTPDRPVAGHNCCIGCAERNLDLAGPKEICPGVGDPIPTRVLAPIPKGWANRPTVKKQHQDALRQVLATDHKPPSGRGSGIVTIGGGKWWPMILVQIRLLREAGCNLPVQVWHRGRSEPVFPEDLKGLGSVKLIDTTKWAVEHPARQLVSWPAKMYAVAYSGFRKVMYLDADAYPVNDPAPLFDLLDHHPFLWWEDIPTMDPHTKWESTGIVNDGTVRPIQGGHWLCNRTLWWHELMCWHWYCQHSDFWFSHSWSDQEGLRMILTALGTPTLRLGAVRMIGPAFSCDYQGVPYVVHRVQGKMWAPWDAKPGDKINRNDDLPKEKRAFEVYEEVIALNKG